VLCFFGGVGMLERLSFLSFSLFDTIFRFREEEERWIGRQRHLYLRVFFVFDYFNYKNKRENAKHPLAAIEKKTPDILYNISHLFFF